MAIGAEERLKTSIHVYSAFREAAEKHAERVALKGEGGRGRQYTYLEARLLVEKLAAGLVADGLVDPPEIGLLSENRPEWPLTYLAILAAGGTVVPLDASLKPSEIELLVHQAGLRVIFCSGRFESQLQSISDELRLFSFEKKSACSFECLTDHRHEFRLQPAASTAVLIFTSGTTGQPKAVELTHKNLLANLESIRAALGFDHTDVFLSVLPLHHTLEATCGFLTPLTSGSTVVYARSLKSRELREDIAANRVNLMCGVPLLYEKLYHAIRRGIASAPLQRRFLFAVLFAISSAGWRLGRKWGKSLFTGLRGKADLGSVRMFVSGGAALPPMIARFFNLIGIDFLQGYGLTETSPVVSVNRPEDIKFSSVGPSLDGVEVRIDHPDAAGIGEILIRGDNVTPGYRDNPEQTAELVRDGWLYTGDLGTLKNGHLWITGRAKNVIVSAAGKNIYPEELEDKLLESQYILEALVFGQKKQSRQGEEIVAIIVPDLEQFRSDFGMDPKSPNSDQIRRVLDQEVRSTNGRMADYKRIREFRVSLEELEKTSTKKVKRYKYALR